MDGTERAAARQTIGAAGRDRADSSALVSGPGVRIAGRYVLGELIGAGGMGRVYRAHDEVLDRDVALKVLDRPEAGEDAARLGEACAAARLTHPGIAKVFDCGRDAGHAFIVTELVRGSTLDELLRERGVLGSAEAIELGGRLADALDHAHRRGVIHCDVKPQNVIVTPEGEPKLVDFGIAQVAAAPRAEIVAGSAPYLAPEQVSGGPIDGRVDVYALGAVLYELLTGRPPFDGGNAAAVISRRLVADPAAPQALNPAVPAELGEVILRALARDPGQRYARAGDFGDGLRGVAMAAREPTARRGAVPARPPGRWRSRPHPRLALRRPRTLLIGAAILLPWLLLAVLVGQIGRSSPPPDAPPDPVIRPIAAASPSVGGAAATATDLPVVATPAAGAVTPFWVSNHRIAEMWNGPDGPGRAVSLGTTSHQFCAFLVVQPEVRGRLFVLNPYTDSHVWIDASAVGPVGPPQKRVGLRPPGRNCSRNDPR